MDYTKPLHYLQISHLEIVVLLKIFTEPIQAVNCPVKRQVFDHMKEIKNITGGD